MTLALALLAHRAYSQGTQGQLPDPITGMRLMVYADMLNLSPQQGQALDDLHAAYRAEFQHLREGEIEDWLKTRGEAYKRAYFTEKRRVIERIAAIDERFFDAVAALLSDEQAARLPRARSLRARERMMQVDDAWEGRDAMPFDLSQAIGEMALPVEQRTAIDAIMAPYESALTRAFQKCLADHVASSDACFDAYERAGWTEARRADDPKAEAYFAVGKPIFDEHSRRQHARMTEMVALNRRTIEALSPLMTPESARELHLRFLSATYSNTHYLSMMPFLVRVTSPYDKALARESLSDDQRAILRTQADAFQREIDAAIAVMVEKIERHRDTYVGDFDWKAEFESRNALDRAVDDSWKALNAKRAAASESIAALVGKEPEVVPEEPDPSSVDLSKVSVYGLIFETGGISGWGPGPMSGRDVTTFSRWLRIDASRFAHLQGMHQRYLADFETLKAAHRPALREASAALHAGDTIEGYTRENLQRMRNLRKVAQDAQRAAEETFFTEVATAFVIEADYPGLLRVRQARERHWLNTAGHRSDTAQRGGRHDGVIDLERMLRRVRDLDLSVPAVDQILLEYEQAVMPLMKAQHDAMTAYATLSDDLRVEWQEQRVATGEERPDMTARSDEAGVEGLKSVAIKSCEPVAELNRATMARLIAALPPDAAERLRRTFERLAWPRIYGDASHAGPLLAAALRLDDLTARQRTELEAVAAEYHPAYAAMCESMTAAVEHADSAIYDQENATQEELLAFWERNGQRKRMLFDRHEFNVRAWRQLKGVLSEVQAKAIGLGAAPPEGPHEHEDFGS